MYELIQAGEKSWYIKSPANVGVYRMNDEEVCLIDSGNDKDAGRKILKIITERGWRVSCIVNTHSNADHTGGNQFIQGRTGCRVLSTDVENAVSRHPMLEPTMLYGGSTYLGGLLVGSLVLILGIQCTHQPLATLLCMLAPAVALAHAFGRIGCFLGGCCYGAPAPGWLGVVYPVGSDAYVHCGAQPLYPTQLFEAALNFLLFWMMVRWTSFQFRPTVYFMGYGIGRFLVEFLRADARGELLPGLSPSQWFSLLLILVGLIWWRGVTRGWIKVVEVLPSTATQSPPTDGKE